MFSKFDKLFEMAVKGTEESELVMEEVLVDARFMSRVTTMSSYTITEDQMINDLTVKELLSKSYAKHDEFEVHVFQVFMNNLSIIKTALAVDIEVRETRKIVDKMKDTIIAEMKVYA